MRQMLCRALAHVCSQCRWAIVVRIQNDKYRTGCWTDWVLDIQFLIRPCISRLACRVPYAWSTVWKHHSWCLKSRAESPIWRRLRDVPSWASRGRRKFSGCFATGKPECDVHTDGLGAFNALVDEGHAHATIVAAGRREKTETTSTRWLNVVLSNIKRSLSGAYHSIQQKKYARRYLAEATWRFNRAQRLRSAAFWKLFRCFVFLAKYSSIFSLLPSSRGTSRAS